MNNCDLGGREKIRKFLGRFFNIDLVSEQDNFFEKSFVNSLLYMQLVMFIENDFHITILPEDLDLQNFNSINNIMKFIESKNNVKVG
ncbi:MAG: hypothetical protein K0R09_817 [Clostridiales bacterium]|jgi:acyl carrier protein|nr:hypothetical protein [Clostridiales bacterium]